MYNIFRRLHSMGSTPQNNGNNKTNPDNENEPLIDENETVSAPETEKHTQKPEHKREPKTVTITDVELIELQRELKEYKDKYLHALAESENARKRLQKEKQELIQYAIQNVIVDFLNPIDHLENALKFTQQMSDEVKHWAVGFQMILTQFKDVLTNNGVTPFTSVGKPFDPHLHEAIETVCTTDFPAGTVVQETLRGYKMGDRIIRPARVTVAKSPSNENNQQKETQEQSKNKTGA